MNAESGSTITTSPPLLADPGDSAQMWTTAEAAQQLGRSERTVRRMLQNGVLQGTKVRGKFGDQWLVAPFDADAIDLFGIKAQSTIRHLDLATGELFCADPAQLDANSLVEAENSTDQTSKTRVPFDRTRTLSDNPQIEQSGWQSIVNLLRTIFMLIFARRSA